MKKITMLLTDDTAKVLLGLIGDLDPVNLVMEDVGGEPETPKATPKRRKPANAGARSGAVRKAILGLMVDKPTGSFLTVAAMETAVKEAGLNPHSASPARHVMTREGLLSKLDRGVYAITQKGAIEAEKEKLTP